MTRCLKHTVHLQEATCLCGRLRRSWRDMILDGDAKRAPNPAPSGLTRRRSECLELQSNAHFAPVAPAGFSDLRPRPSPQVNHPIGPKPRSLWNPRGIPQAIMKAVFRGRQKTLDLRLCRSRLGESNPRSTHYEGAANMRTRLSPALIAHHGAHSALDAPHER